MYNITMADLKDQEIGPNAKVTLSIRTLFTIFSAGVNYGSNEGDLPEYGTLEVFNNLIRSRPLTPDDNAYYSIADKIEIIKGNLVFISVDNLKKLF